MMSTCNQSTLSLLFFLVLGCCFTSEAALTKQHSRLHQGAGLRGAPTNADESTKEDTADDDDDDDDDDDADTAAAPAPAKPAAKKEVKKEDKATTKRITKEKINPHAAEEARMTKALLTAMQELAENRREQSEITLRVKHLSDPQRSDQEIDSSAKLVANETESPAMGDMLGHMWKEMRMFEVPLYAEGAKEELAHLKRHEEVSEAKVEAAQRKLSAAQKKWAKEAKKGKKEAKKGTKATMKEDEDKEQEKSEGADGDAEKDAEEPKKSQEMKVEATPIKRINTLDKVPINTWNFWAMEYKRKMATLLTSFVYLVSGIILAFVYKKLRDLYPESFTAVQKGGVYASPKDFSHSIFACFGDIKICVAGCFCPGMRWADTLDSTKDGITQRKHMPYWKAFFAFFICVLLHIYTWGISSVALVIIGVVYRQKLRQTYKIENRTPKTWALDILAWTCCLPCAIIQEARESSAQRV